MANNKLCDTCAHENVCKDREEVLGTYKELTQVNVAMSELVSGTYECSNHMPRVIQSRKPLHPERCFG